MVRDFSLNAAFVSVTRTVAAAVPTSGAPGARWMFPVPAPVPGVVVVTVMNAGPDVFENVRALPSGSVPVITWSAVAPALTVMFAGWLSVGARFVFAIVRVVEAEFAPPTPSSTCQLIVWVPASEKPGVPEIEAVRGDTPGESVVNVRSPGIP